MKLQHATPKSENNLATSTAVYNPMSPSKVELAVLNNVRWYETMFAAHGLASQTDGRVWRSRETPPPFHSNLVVLSPTATQQDIEAYASDIETRRHHTGWSLKDSYATLDLASLGCSMLFEAEWIWRDPVSASASKVESHLTWTRVSTRSELANWERSWWGDARNEAERAGTRQFPNSLLDSGDHAFFAGVLDGKVLAGAIANRSPGVVGLSNVFSPPDLLEDTWNALAASMTAAFPGASIVGYERGNDLAFAQRAGFASIGKLRVWCWSA
jgi:hypothetical protein